MNQSKVAITKCSCKHEYQDKLYGKGNRVCNETIKNKLRCTVCQREHEKTKIIH
jgi:hypothetical protein